MATEVLLFVQIEPSQARSTISSYLNRNLIQIQVSSQVSSCSFTIRLAIGYTRVRIGASFAAMCHNVMVIKAHIKRVKQILKLYNVWFIDSRSQIIVPRVFVAKIYFVQQQQQQLQQVLISEDNILTQWVPAAAVVTSPTYYVLSSERSRLPCTTLFIL